MAKQINREGHRQRLRDSYIKSGINSLPEHNVLELLLTYAIPRKDVKDIAYSLLNRFNSIEGVLSADIDELTKIDGIGRNSAILIKLFYDIINSTEPGKKNIVLNSFLDLKEFALSEFESVDCPFFAVVYNNELNEIISYEIIKKGGFSLDELDLKEIVKGILKNNSMNVFFIHKRVNETYMPQQEDIDLIGRLQSLFKPLKIKLDDYITVGDDGALSMNNDIRYCLYLDK